MPEIRSDAAEPGSPDEGSNFRRSLQIDMKGLVGDAVGNMSISPGSRDVVLAARKGLFIIDLESPLNVPRFLPQGGTWDVADVQWNPHLARTEYIVSTSGEKLLIWNLYLAGKTSIEHVLRSHYRAITDINWHTSDPDVVASTGIDSWIYAWDIRTPQKPIMGLSAFNAGGTQVKWNRQDANILASSHLNEVLIWDRRKGSLPISRINAHKAKIYGIDWAHDRRQEIVTCSLDKTIKIWNVHMAAEETSEPEIVIHTAYPVWRARDLPFGRGVLSLPQRGETTLEMYAHESPEAPVEVFEGHVDVVKEFVWRKGGQDDSEFQLITWSKDKTLRFWPVDTLVMQKAGITPTRTVTTTNYRSDYKGSFSNPPAATDLPPALSAPVGHRGILAEVRAPMPPRPPRSNQHFERPISFVAADDPAKHTDAPRSKPITIAQQKGGTMSRGYAGGKSAQITTFAWLSSVKVGGRKEGSSGPGSGTESGNVSRLSSTSRPPPSLLDFSGPHAVSRIHNKEKFDDELREGEAAQSLQDEITSVINKLTASKVKLEKADLKKRTCTFGLHGPWGESTSVFIRISFTFPKQYPYAEYPEGIPTIDLERNSLVSMKNRALILRRLRGIREHSRPCLEKCLRFLLFGNEDENVGGSLPIDSGSSSEEEAAPVLRKAKELTFALPRGDKNLAEPRTSQGVFSANGELVCFFRAPPRIVRNPLRDISVSPSIPSRGTDAAPRLFQSPALLSDAIRRLSYAALDREPESSDQKKIEGASNILRIVSNVFTYSFQKPRRPSEQSRPLEDIPASYSLLPTRRSTVYIRRAPSLLGFDVAAAVDYVLGSTNPVELCKNNACISRQHNRPDHYRAFKLLEVILMNISKRHLYPEINKPSALTVNLVQKLYNELATAKDIQMLAMMSAFLLYAANMCNETTRTPSSEPSPSPAVISAELKTEGSGYFDLRKRQHSRHDSFSPGWPRPFPSPMSRPAAPPLSPASSRGSWSSIFNTTSVRQLVAGSQARSSIPVPGGGKSHHASVLRGYRLESPPPTPPSAMSWQDPRNSRSVTTPPSAMSWSDTRNSRSVASAVTFSSAGHTIRRPTFSQVLASRPISAERKKVVLRSTLQERREVSSIHSLPSNQLLCHILAYADMLLAWQLPQKRSELLKLVEENLHAVLMDATIIDSHLDPGMLGSCRICERCMHVNDSGQAICADCATTIPRARCSICRLPAKGLSFLCAICSHVSHIKCWRNRRNPICASGCGCLCSQTVDEQTLVLPSDSLSTYDQQVSAR